MADEQVDKVIKGFKDYKKPGFGFGINDCPLWLFREFKEECQRMHNDTHWVTLLSWYEKARAYDAMTSGMMAVPEKEEPQEQEKEEEKEDGVSTLGGGKARTR